MSLMFLPAFFVGRGEEQVVAGYSEFKIQNSATPMLSRGRAGIASKSETFAERI